jgi:hypothetical protein
MSASPSVRSKLIAAPGLAVARDAIAIQYRNESSTTVGGYIERSSCSIVSRSPCVSRTSSTAASCSSGVPGSLGQVLKRMSAEVRSGCVAAKRTHIWPP